MKSARWSIDVTCPRCGVPLESVSTGAAHPSLCLDTRAVARCQPCRETWVIAVSLSSTSVLTRAETSMNSHHVKAAS